MDLPKPPEDPELCTIIDKLAQFVARNGPDFEQMTKNKQKDNAKFSFLFGGEHFNYYQYKVTTEQAILKQKQKVLELQQQQAVQQAQQAAAVTANNVYPTTVPPTASFPPQGNAQTAWQASLAKLQEQVEQSERNLAAQYQVLMQQQQVQVEEAIRKAEDEKLETLAKSCDIDLEEFDRVVQPIVETCTKDAISVGKSYIFNLALSSQHTDVIAQYLLKSIFRITSSGSPFDLKLHLTYLMNDVLHHCVRKNADDLKNSLEVAVVPIFCVTSLAATEEQKQKLIKLLKLWETNNYFAPDILEQLKNPAESLAAYQANLLTENSDVITSITSAIQSQYASLQKQHQDFVAHVNAQQQLICTALQQAPPGFAPPVDNQPAISSGPDQKVLPNDIAPNADIMPPSFSQPPPPVFSSFNQPPPGYNQPQGFPVNFNQPPPTFPGINTQAYCGPPVLPDLSRPPPGYLPPVLAEEMYPHDEPEQPSVPYFDLPAGLMVPLVKLELHEYRRLNPDDIRLPPPQPPSERLLTAVEMFYSPPSHDRPRNSEGWEQLGLYEFFKAKSMARKRKEEDILMARKQRSRTPTPDPELNRPRSKSRSISPLNRRKFKEEKPKKEEPEPTPPSRPGWRENKTHTPEKSRSPLPYQRRSASRSPSPSPPPPTPPPPPARRRRSASKSPSPPSPNGRRRRSASRSPTPPSFFGGAYASTNVTRKLDEKNKGHQLLKKMGWGGAGLGAAEQGIQDPISGGEIRDRQDMYKGIGINLNDPFESFRKTKGQAFISRMRQRAEEKVSTSQ